MTVIRGNKTFNYPKPGSTAASDTESLHLGSVSASDTESLNNEPHSVSNPYFRPPPVKLADVEELVNIKKSSGRKKLRRYQNRCVLTTLNEEDEDTVPVVMEDYKSPFARLLEDSHALEYWNSFIEKSEEEQTEIVRAFSENCYSHKNCTLNKKPEKRGRLSNKIKRTIKIKKNLSIEVVKDSEDDLLDFFKMTPNDIYVKSPPSSFDRLLLHAIAQYHGLKSTSVLAGDKRIIEIDNGNETWVPAECFLTDFIQQLRR